MIDGAALVRAPHCNDERRQEAVADLRDGPRAHLALVMGRRVLRARRIVWSDLLAATTDAMPMTTK